MRLIILILSVLSLNSLAYFQYPEERIYTSSDRGISPYNAKSIYHTGTFALTFDDGPHPIYTSQYLDLLKKYQTKATFFVLSSKINEQNFHLIKRMLDEGHIVASHGLDHNNSNDLSQFVWKASVRQSFLDLAKWHKRAGHEMTQFFYRFPYGAYGSRPEYHHINALKDLSYELLGDNCINMAFWDVDSNDWVPGMTGKEVASNIIAEFEGGTYIDFKQSGPTYIKVPMLITKPRGGGVILQHDVHSNSLEGVEIFLQYAKIRGLRIPRLDEVEEFRVTKNCKL